MPGALGAGLGALIFPLSIAAMLLKNRGNGLPARFRAAGAVGPDTARKPATLKLTHNERIELEAYVAGGAIVRLADGRYYLDVTRHRRRSIRNAIIMAAIVTTIVVVVGPLMWEAMLPQSG